MIDVREAEPFTRWFARLRDVQARARISVRIRRLSLGNPGDVKALGGGISELRVDYGPGYRIYCAWRGSALVVLLADGDKSSQARDIAEARRIATELED